MNNQDRQDDRVDKYGVPISEAHKAIYDHLDECRDDIVDHIDQKINSHFESAHDGLIVLHHPIADVFGDVSPDVAMRRVVAMSKQFDELADAVLGTPKSQFLGGGRRDDGLIAKNDALYQKLGNGQKIEATMSWGDRTWPTLIVVIIGGIAKVFGWI